MTKLSNIPAKETTAKTAKTRKAKTELAKPKWDPTKPVQFTQEEIWEHIHEIEKGPFYAAWCTVCTHDTYAGLRVNGKNQVVDLKGDVIPGLYCGGESAGGCSMHGLGRCLTAGYVIGGEVVKEG